MRILMLLVIIGFGIICSGAEENPGSRRNRGEWGSQRMNRGDRGGFNRSGERGGFNRYGERGGAGRFGGGMMMRNQFFAEVEIAQKFPQEYAKIDALRKEYEAKLAELAKKASVELPAARDAAYRKLREAAPAEFDAAVAKMKTSPRDGMTDLMALAKKHGIELFSRGNSRPSSGAPQAAAPKESVRVFARPDMATLRKKYPKEMGEYDAMRQKDRNKAREMLLRIIELDKSGKK